MAWNDDLKSRMDQLVKEVEDSRGVTASVEVLINGLVAQQAAMRAQIEELQKSAVDPALLQPILAQLDETMIANQSNIDRLKAAVVAGSNV